jgi:hypothetical protein
MEDGRNMKLFHVLQYIKSCKCLPFYLEFSAAIIRSFYFAHSFVCCLTMVWACQRRNNINNRRYVLRIVERKVVCGNYLFRRYYSDIALECQRIIVKVKC